MIRILGVMAFASLLSCWAMCNKDLDDDSSNISLEGLYYHGKCGRELKYWEILMKKDSIFLFRNDIGLYSSVEYTRLSDNVVGIILDEPRDTATLSFSISANELRFEENKYLFANYKRVPEEPLGRANLARPYERENYLKWLDSFSSRYMTFAEGCK